MKQQGYTLVELIIVVGITVIMLLTAVSLFYTTMIGGSKTTTTEDVKQSGQYALNQLTYMIYNARKLVPNADGTTICAAGMTSLGLQNQDLNTTIFQTATVNGFVRIASNSGVYLTPANMNVTDGPTFTCTQPTDSSSPTISIAFTLKKGTDGVDNPRNIISIPFQTQVSLRNY